MLDVHPPHHPTHTWKDFFIHIATIVVGLLIAVGIEQTVEYFHHRHQRHQLEQDLREEGLKNQAGREMMLRYLDLTESLLLDRLTAINEMRMGHLKEMPAMPPSFAARTKDLDRTSQVLPSKAAWTTAQESQLLELLPREDAEAYAQLYRQADLALQYAVARNGFGERVLAYQLKFSDRRTPGVLEPSRMTEQQMDEYSTRLAEFAASMGTLRSFYARFCGQNDAMLNGTRSLNEILRAGDAAVAEDAAVAALPTGFGVVAKDTPKPAPK